MRDFLESGVADAIALLVLAGGVAVFLGWLVNAAKMVFLWRRLKRKADDA